ncbi:hypothetical protein FQN60_008883, partial [Etheostoma spectabile]
MLMRWVRKGGRSQAIDLRRLLAVIKTEYHSAASSRVHHLLMLWKNPKSQSQEEHGIPFWSGQSIYHPLGDGGDGGGCEPRALLCSRTLVPLGWKNASRLGIKPWPSARQQASTTPSLHQQIWATSMYTITSAYMYSASVCMLTGTAATLKEQEEMAIPSCQPDLQ